MSQIHWNVVLWMHSFHLPTLLKLIQFFKTFLHLYHIYLWKIKNDSWKIEINELLKYNTIVLFQNNLHAVSIEGGYMFAVDITSGSYIYSRKLDSFQPFAITVYDSDSTGPFIGKWTNQDTWSCCSTPLILRTTIE